MEPIESVIYHRPAWRQQKTFQNRFELRDGEQIFAALEFPKTFGSLAVAAATTGKWTFKRVGFFKTNITVRAEGQSEDIAVYHPRWTGTEGSLIFNNGASYLWKVSNFWATQFAWRDAQGRTLITYRSGLEDSGVSDWIKTQARVEFQTDSISTDFRRSQEFALLVVLGWYLVVLTNQDSAATTAVIAVS